VPVGDFDCAFGLFSSLFGFSHAASSNAATLERCAVRATQGRLRVSRYFFGHAGFSGILLEGNSGAWAFVGPGATRGRLFTPPPKKRKREKKGKKGNLSKFRKRSVENSQNFENKGRTKNANLVDLEKCCKMRLCSLS
jgi:hypothetical protein